MLFKFSVWTSQSQNVLNLYVFQYLLPIFGLISVEKMFLSNKSEYGY